MLLGDLFDLSLRGRAGAVGLVCDAPGGPRELTFGEIADRAARVAACCAGAVSSRATGSRCSCRTGSSSSTSSSPACSLGVVLVPINVLYREREIAHIVGDAEPKLIVATETHRGAVPPGSPVVDVDELMREARDGDGGVPRPAIDGDAPAAIVYTSGTTGRSKGAVLTHNNFAANAAALVTCWRITSADRYLAVLPLFHVHGLGNGVCAWLASGCLMRLTERFDAAKALDGSRTSSRRSSSACRPSTSACSSCRPRRPARSGRGRGCSCRGRRRSRRTCSSSSASASATRSSSATG